MKPIKLVSKEHSPIRKAICKLDNLLPEDLGEDTNKILQTLNDVYDELDKVEAVLIHCIDDDKFYELTGIKLEEL